MNNTNSIYIHSQTALPKEYSNLIKEGSSVLVRILKDSGNGKYIASFGGGRYQITSKEKLVPGSTFMAKVSIQNGKLNLAKIQNQSQTQNLQNQNAVQNQQADKPVVQSSNVMSSQVAELLASLGLPADNVSKMLVQTLVGSGAKINLEKLNKARNAAMNFPGQEEEACEAALILLDKGIAPTVENIRDVMTGFGLSEEVDKNSRDLDIKEKSNAEIEEIASELKEFFKSLTEDKKLPHGFLTVFNHLACNTDCDKEKNSGSSERMHWVIIPFEFGFNRHEKPVNGNGVFRVFFNLKENFVKKLVINFIIDGKMWTFVVTFKGEKLERLKFSHSPQFDEEKNTRLKVELEEYFENVPVEQVLTDNLAGFASGDILLSLAKGYA